MSFVHVTVAELFPLEQASIQKELALPTCHISQDLIQAAVWRLTGKIM